MRINEEFRAIIPPLSEEELIQLEANILADGIRDPLAVWGDVIIDGHNRYDIAQKHDLEYDIVEIDFEDDNAAKEWIILNQFGRRNLNKYQRSTLALKLEDVFKARAKEKEKIRKTSRQKSDKSKPDTKVDTKRELAQKAQVSQDTIAKVKQIEKEADKKTKEKLEKGEISINQAHKELKKKDNQEKIDRRKKEIAQNIKSGLKTKPVIYHKDCLEFLVDAPMADLLLTDPPYMTDVDNIDEFAQSWLSMALSKVKKTGHAYIFIGAYPEEVRAYLNCELPTQILIWEYKNTLGQNPNDRYKQNYQMILYYKMPKAGNLNIDMTNEQWSVHSMNAPDGRLGDRYHSWQKPIKLAERLITHSTQKGDTIIDPFCCTGTFLLAASKCERKAIGGDISEENIEIAQERGCELQ